MVITSLIGTGYGNSRHMAPIISFHAIFLSFVLGNMKFDRSTIRNPIFALIIIIFILPQAYIFWNNGEKQSYAASRTQENKELFTYKFADALSETLKGRDNTVLVLGGYSTVVRLVDYKPFMGLNTDVFSYVIMPGLYGDDFIDSFKENLKKVDTAIILPDYPNVEWAGGSINNEIYKITEDYLSKNFKLQKEVKGKNFYPLNPNLYNKGALIYVREQTEILSFYFFLQFKILRQIIFGYFVNFIVNTTSGPLYVWIIGEDNSRINFFQVFLEGVYKIISI